MKLTEKIENILTENLPKGVIFKVWEHKIIFGDIWTCFKIQTSEKQIHNVSGQFPDLVSYAIENDLTMHSQVFGGNGGGYLYRNINPAEPKEKYLAMQSVKIPFKQPKKQEKFILNACKSICINYCKILQDFKEQGLLRYTDLTDYSFLK